MKNKFMKKVMLSLVIVAALSFVGGLATVKTPAYAAASARVVKEVGITLNDGITVRYTLLVPAGYTKAVMNFTLEEKTYIVEKDNLVEGLNIITFDKTAPQYMASGISYTLSLTGENKSEIFEVSAEDFSVKAYAESLLSSSAYELSLPVQGYADMKVLLFDLLSYGKSAAAYSEIGADPTVGVTLDSSVFVAPTVTVKNSVGTAFKNAGLCFGDKVGLYFDFAGEAQKIVAEKNGEESVITRFKEVDGLKRVIYDDIGVLEFDTPVTVKLYNEGETEPFASATYSVASNVYSSENGAYFGENMKNLLRAVYAYGKSAEKYSESKAVFNLEETRLEAEDTKYVTYLTENLRNSGVVKDYSNGGACLGNFKTGNTVTVKIKAETAGKTSVSMRAASQWIVKYGVNSSGKPDTGMAYIAADMLANKVFKLYVNDKEVTLGDDVIIPGGKASSTSGDKATFCCYDDVLLGDFDFNAGENTIVLEFIEHTYFNNNDEKTLSSPIIDGFTVTSGDVHKHIPTDEGTKTRTHDLYNSDITEYTCSLCKTTYKVRGFAHDYADVTGTPKSDFSVEAASAKSNGTLGDNVEIIGYDSDNNAPRWSNSGGVLYVTNVRNSGMRFNKTIEDETVNIYVYDVFNSGNNVPKYTVVIEFNDETEERKLLDISAVNNDKWRYIGKYSSVKSVALLQTEYEANEEKFLRLVKVAFVPENECFKCSVCGKIK